MTDVSRLEYCRDISIVRPNPDGGGLYANPQGPEINAGMALSLV